MTESSKHDMQVNTLRHLIESRGGITAKDAEA
jgi:hypothetical protein